ncbi:MAG TPA: neutral/alkaline non-lysosomal ceramidase N-terminal domain-containing protein [Actinomycetota bacterium]
MRRFRASAIAVALAVVVTPAAARSSAEPDAVLRAGVGVADATYQVGIGSGQYSDKNPNALGLVTGEEFDPFNHSNVQQHSYGVQSRLTYRALVVEGTNGKRIALVKSDSYLAQDLLVRRVAQILDANQTSGIGYDQILLHASHNHSSPYYMSPAWGVWLFQDAFEIRAFEYHARQMAASIEQAAAALRPVRIGATTIKHTIYKGNITGRGLADDGTPRGYPETWGGEGGWADFGVTVMRIDDVTNPDQPEPYAIWMNHGQHPESLDGYDLITADFLGPLERFVERDTGATLVYSQGDVGSSEGPYFRSNYETLPDGVIRAWAHVGHAQTERGARYLADTVVQAFDEIGDGEGAVPFTTQAPVDYLSMFFPGPLSHPYPSVSNCRTESTVEGNPGSPILGLPDCERAGGNDPQNMAWENLKEHGFPVPDHYDAPGFAAVEENLRLRLQTFRIGDVVLGSCACEAQMDLILNFESRANDVAGDFVNGFDWTELPGNCAQNPDTTWTCSLPQTTTFSNARYERMRAQVHNPADGWDAAENAVAANSEPADPAAIWGNFGREELDENTGYKLVVGIGHATDYNGYTVSYREYMAYDHYRKALTSYGPHTADYMVTRLVRMAGQLHGGPAVPAEPHSALVAVDEARQEAIAIALGQASNAAYNTWLAALPNDVGPAAAVEQPADVTRFDAAAFTWRGGSNAVDNPVVAVERLVRGDWVPYADQSGEVQTKVRFPAGGLNALTDTYSGNQEWLWTANFEAFDAFPVTVHPDRQTPDGDYRFVVGGVIRQGGSNVPYSFESEPFHVGAWEGITASGSGIDGGTAWVTVGSIVYPRTYGSAFRYVGDDGNAVLCKTCSFRPWAATSTVESVTFTVNGAEVPGAISDGRWEVPYQPGDSVIVAAGGIRDSYGETNGAPIPIA